MTEAWLAIGAGMGTVLFTGTQEPVWIGVGAALGAALGITKTRSNHCQD